jgi:hypothetical protein
MFTHVYAQQPVSANTAFLRIFTSVYAVVSHLRKSRSYSSPENISARGRGPYMSRDQPMAHAFVCRSLVPLPLPMGWEGWWLGGVSYLSARRARSRRSTVTVQRWPCRGAPLVVSSAEGATRRSVTVCRHQPVHATGGTSSSADHYFFLWRSVTFRPPCRPSALQPTRPPAGRSVSPVRPAVRPSVSPSVHPPTGQPCLPSVRAGRRSARPSHPFVRPAGPLSVCPPAGPSVRRSACPSRPTVRPACLPSVRSGRRSARQSHPPVRPAGRLSVRPPAGPPVRRSACLEGN